MGMLEHKSVGRRRVSALPGRCILVNRRQPQHPRPTDDPSVPLFAKNISQARPMPSYRESI
jgi:hypothetical protein